MYRAYSQEKALDTPTRIYYKDVGVSPSGSHHQLECFEAGILFAQIEGIIPVRKQIMRLRRCWRKHNGRRKKAGVRRSADSATSTWQRTKLTCRVNLVENKLSQQAIQDSLAELNTPEIA